MAADVAAEPTWSRVSEWIARRTGLHFPPERHGDLLNRITHAIGERQDLRSIFQVVVERLEQHLPIDFGCVFVHDAARKLLSLSSAGLKLPDLASVLVTVDAADMDGGDDGLARALRGRLAYEPDVSAIGAPFPQQLAREALRSVVAAPLVVEERPPQVDHLLSKPPRLHELREALARCYVPRATES